MSNTQSRHSTASTPTPFDSAPNVEPLITDSEELSEETNENEPEGHKLECLLTEQQIDDTPKEKNIQEVLRMLLDEYGFEKADLARDFQLVGELENGKKWRRRIELAVYATGKAHSQDNLVRLIVVTDPKVKANDPKKGQAALEESLEWPATASLGCGRTAQSSTFCRPSYRPTTCRRLTSCRISRG